MSENATPTVVLTKEEKLKKISEQIAKLQARYDDVLNDRQPVKAKKEVFVPEVGAIVLATVGRATPTTQPSVKEGVVVAVKHPEVDAEGKAKGAIQVRVQIGSGFDAQLVTLYPAQLQLAPASA